ncbi:MAG: ATP-binding cassette domain-containing protein, partial [Ruminococcaceae bacterium]|nr:ATP-binding cassette domain-containing protein [Oscillospiraceae bacterium]
ALYKAVDAVITKTGLGAYADRLIKNLSKGYKQRVGIAQAIIGDPEIIILDEPTVGLDPRQIIEIRELIKELGQDHTVILSSHILTEISAVCDYVIIIANGKIVASDTLENLTKLYEGKNYIDLTVRGEESKIRRALESIREIESIEIEGGLLGQLHIRIATDNKSDIREEVFFRFADMKAPILSMDYEEVTLEKVFLELTSGDAKKNTKIDMADEAAEEARLTAEEIFAASAVENMKKRAEAETSHDEETKKVSPDKSGKKSDDSDDDYKPLFGGK